jgi:hypothetical protein
MLKKLTITVACGAFALIAMTPGATAAGRGGRLAKGHTGQGRSIRIRVLPDQIKIQGFSIELRCSGGYILVDQESGFQPTLVKRKGRFHDRQYGSTDEVLIRGHLRGHLLRGQIRVRDRLGKHRCSSPWIGFTAKKH